jgi:5'-deoxynucleotidase YfbR-like HD superfamily hydrolase
MPLLRPAQIAAIQQVQRWHTRSSLRAQSVAEHSHQVALLALFIAPETITMEEAQQLVYLALVHDAHEAEFGDTPYPAKHALLRKGIDIDGVSRQEFWQGRDPYLEVPPHLRLILDAADILEAALYAQKYLPEIAADVCAQAVKTAKGLSHYGFTRVLFALGLVPEDSL